MSTTLAPRFVHDCALCVFVGTVDVNAEGYLARAYDGYVCVTPSRREIVARYSDDGPDYLAGLAPVGESHPALMAVEALLASQHQPRERAVPCSVCRFYTWNHNARCDAHQH